MYKFKFISDPAHGWLEVGRGLIDNLGLGNRISEHSYQFGEKVYLEEDCDAPVLMSALDSQGIPFEVEEKYKDSYSKIRNYPGYIPTGGRQ
jgi:hypothetical protein